MHTYTFKIDFLNYYDIIYNAPIIYNTYPYIGHPMDQLNPICRGLYDSMESGVQKHVCTILTVARFTRRFNMDKFPYQINEIADLQQIEAWLAAAGFEYVLTGRHNEVPTLQIYI